MAAITLTAIGCAGTPPSKAVPAHAPIATPVALPPSGVCNPARTTTARADFDRAMGVLFDIEQSSPLVALVSLELLTEAAQAGLLDAQYQLGTIVTGHLLPFELGETLTRNDTVRAIAFLRAAARRGHERTTSFFPSLAKDDVDLEVLADQKIPPTWVQEGVERGDEWLQACAADAETPPREDVARRHPFRSAARPDVASRFPFDFAALPREGPPAHRSTSVRTRLAEDGTTFVIDSNLLADARVGGYLWSAGPQGTPPFPDGLDPYLPPNEVPCGKRPQAETRVTLRGIRMDTKTKASVDYLVFEGVVDRFSCTGRLTAKAGVEAVALLPRVLYAFKRCAKGCDADGSERLEELVVIAPEAELLSTSGASGQGRTSGITIATVPIEKGRSASITMQVGDAALRRFSGAPHKDRREREVVGLNVELLWPEDAASPTGEAFVTNVTPHGAELLDAL